MPQEINPFEQWAPGTARLLPPIELDEENPFAQWAPSDPAAETMEPDEEMGEFRKGLSSGIDFAQSTMGVLGIAMGRAFGSEDLEAYGEELRARNVEESQRYQPKVARVEDIGSISEGFDWAAYTLGHLGPSIGASVIGGAVGTIAGGAMGLAPGAVAGGLAGAFAPSLILNAGEVYNDLREKGVDSFEAAATAGIPMALLDMFVPGRVAGKLVWKTAPKGAVKKALKPPRRFRKRLAQETTLAVGIESATEGLQETIALVVETDVTGEKFVTNENLSRILNAAAAGAIGGGAVGPLAAVRRDAEMPGPAPAKEPPSGAPPAVSPPGGPEVDPATGLPIVAAPVEEPPPTEPPAQPAPSGLTGQAAPPPAPIPPQPGEAPGAPYPAPEPPGEAPHAAPAPIEPATGVTPVSGPVTPEPAEILPTPTRTEPPAITFPDDALERIQKTLKGKHRALATKKQQADVAKILGLSKDDAKAIDDALDQIGYVPETAPAPTSLAEPAPTEEAAETEEGWEKATPKATDFVRKKDGGKVTSSMLMKRFDLNKAQAQRLHGHLRSQGILTQKGYAHRKITKPRDVLDIIKEMGGIKPDGDLRAMDLQKARPGIMRHKGRSVSEVREHLEELGIAPTGSKDSVVYDEIGRAIRKEEGRPFHPEDEDLVLAQKAEEAEDQNERALEDARAVIEDSGVDLNDDETEQVMDRVRNGEPVEDALETVIVQDAAQEYLDGAPEEEDIPFDVPAQTKFQPSREGKVVPRQGKKAARPTRAKKEDEKGGKQPSRAGQVQGKEDLRDKEIGEVLGAEERKKPRDTEREKQEVKARSLPTKIRSAKEQKEADEGLFREAETPLEKAIEKKPPTPQVAPLPGMTPLGIAPAEEPLVEQAKEAAPSPADLEGIEIEYPVTVEETKETITVKAKAATALKNVDTRIASLTDLVKCLK